MLSIVFFLCCSETFFFLLQADLGNLLKPLSTLINQVQNFREKNRSSPLFNHLSAVSESVPGFCWVAVVSRHLLLALRLSLPLYFFLLTTSSYPFILFFFPLDSFFPPRFFFPAFSVTYSFLTFSFSAFPSFCFFFSPFLIILLHIDFVCDSRVAD